MSHSISEEVLNPDYSVSSTTKKITSDECMSPSLEETSRLRNTRNVKPMEIITTHDHVIDEESPNEIQKGFRDRKVQKLFPFAQSHSENLDQTKKEQGPSQCVNTQDMNYLTLGFEDSDNEHQWTYQRIRSKRFLCIAGYIFMTLLNVWQISTDLRKFGFTKQIGMFIVFQFLAIFLIYLTFFKDHEQMKQIFDVYKRDIEFVSDQTEKKNLMNSFSNTMSDFNVTDFYTQMLKQQLMRQKYYYFALTLTFNLNQLAHEVLDPINPEGQKYDDYYLQSFYYGITLSLIICAMFLLSVKYIYSVFMITLYGVTVAFSILNSPHHGELHIHYFFCFIFFTLTFIPIFYIDERESKKYFLGQQKIFRLLREQKQILNDLPDGLIIHLNKQKQAPKSMRGLKVQNSEQSIKYVNETMKQMITNGKKLGDLSSLKKIFLKQTSYQIVDQNVTTINQPIKNPRSLFDSVFSLHNGQVYEFINENEMVKNREKIFLVQVIKQTVNLNDQQHVLTFFKDVTFGVLYEQIKAQEDFKNAINSTIQQKFRVPLQAVVQSCYQLMNSPSLQKFERNKLKSQALTTQLMGMVFQCKSVIFKMNDMQDFQSIQKGILRTKNISFNLQEKIVEIQNIVKFKAQMKNLEIVFETNFDQHLQIVQQIQFDQLLKSLVKSNQKIEDHPLLGYIPQIDKIQLLPRFVVGDCDRLQQISLNIIQNSLHNTFQGKIIVYFGYDKKEQKLVVIVNDRGQGIPQDQHNSLFQLMQRDKGDKNIGIGLYVSKQIAENNGGQLDFISMWQQGSTFIFTFELEVDDQQQQIEEEIIEFDKSEDSICDISPRFGSSSEIMIQANYSQNETTDAPREQSKINLQISQSFGKQNTFENVSNK